MRITRTHILTALALLVLAALLALGAWHYTHRAKGPELAPQPLAVYDDAPAALIGAIVALGQNTLTVRGLPPGNKEPVELTATVDSSTALFSVAAGTFATSSITFADLKVGMTVNLSAEAAKDGVRHAIRVIIPPAASAPAGDK